MSCSQINANVLRHEAGTGVTSAGNNVGHFANYQNAVTETNPSSIGDSDNAGITIENLVDVPTQNTKGFKAIVDQEMKPVYAQLSTAIGVEHGIVNMDADGNITGSINFADATTNTYPVCPK